MFGKHNGLLFVALTVAVALVVILGVVFPITGEYGNLFSHPVSITAKNGNISVTFSGDFKDGYRYEIPQINSTASFGEHSDNNTLTLSFDNGTGGIFYYESTVRMIVNISVEGQVAASLHPSGIGVSYNDTGPSGDDGVIFRLVPPIPNNGSYGDRNVTFNYDQFGGIGGYGNNSGTGTLDLVPANSVLCNFTLNFSTFLTMNWYQNTTHNFAIEVSLNGVGTEVSSAINFSIYEG